MKKLFIIPLMLISFSTVLLQGSCNVDTPTPEPNTQIDGHRGFQINEDHLRDSVFPTFSQTITEDEKNALVFMREEEKLARDVYITLYRKWNKQIFDNISMSEQTHMDAIKGLLDQYNLPDPVGDHEIGEFTNPSLQVLNDSLVNVGMESLVEALKVGAAIEEIDILDLQKYLEETEQEDISMVYGNLLRGSRNHLRAFVRNLEKQGVIYEPQFLDQTTYEEIINGVNERRRWF